MAAAIQRGLDAVDQGDVDVIVSGEFVESVEELDPDSGPYDTDRGFGTVGARTFRRQGQTTVVVNHAVMGEAPLDDVERLLAHEGGHAVLHAADEAMPALRNDRSTSGLAMLRGIASVAIEEYRVERRVLDAGYPEAGLATTDSLNNRLFDFSCTVAEATHDPASDDVITFANLVLIAQHRLTISLSYLAAAVIGGQVSFVADQLPNFARPYWTDTFDRSWRARLDLYRRIPAAGTPWGGSLAATHIRQASEVEHKLLRDVGFSIQSNDVRPDSRWGFRRTGSNEMFEAQEQRIFAELERREAEDKTS